MRVMAESFDDLSELRAGDIAAAAGLKHTRSGKP
jgi:translation elongation factor EF-G